MGVFILFILYVLYLYWCSVTNYHKLKDLKQHNILSYTTTPASIIIYPSLPSSCQDTYAYIGTPG